MPRQRLRKLISKQPEAAPRLPLTHTTDVYRFVNALEDGMLVPPGCTVFKGEPLLYFFYGRPSYRVNSDEAPTSLDHYLPICFLFRNTAVTPIKRIFPFDSGAFSKKLYDDALHRGMHVEDFGLDPDPATPGRIISLFFGSVDSYLRARALPSLNLDPAELEAASYHALVSQRLSNSADNRASGVELQFEGNLKLDGNVEAVIGPGPLLEGPAVKSKLKAANVAVLPYPQIDRQKPSEYVTKIFDVCYEYYRQIHLLP